MKVGVDKTETEWSPLSPLTLTLSPSGEGIPFIHPASWMVFWHIFYKEIYENVILNLF
jgi:hypothetical protein